MKTFIQPNLRVISVDTNDIIATSGDVTNEVGNRSILAPEAYYWDEEE